MFDFKRGDSVIINVLDTDNTTIVSDTGIVLEVRDSEQLEKKVVEIRRDKDGSLWSCNKYGQSHRFTEGNEQFLQVQKIFQPVKLKRGKIISMVSVYDGGEGPKLELFDAEGRKFVSVNFNPENLEFEPIQINYMSERSFQNEK